MQIYSTKAPNYKYEPGNLHSASSLNTNNRKWHLLLNGWGYLIIAKQRKNEQKSGMRVNQDDILALSEMRVMMYLKFSSSHHKHLDLSSAQRDNQGWWRCSWIDHIPVFPLISQHDYRWLMPQLEAKQHEPAAKWAMSWAQQITRARETGGMRRWRREKKKERKSSGWLIPSGCLSDMMPAQSVIAAGSNRCVTPKHDHFQSRPLPLWVHFTSSSKWKKKPSLSSSILYV